MVLTGRAAALVLGSAVVVALLVASGGSAVTLLLVVNAMLLLLLVADVVLAGSPSAVSLARSGHTRCRLGEAAQVQLRVRNDGRRRLRAVVRDAWVPTARAVIAGGGLSHADPDAAGTDRTRIDLVPGMSATLDVRVRPSRRGDRPADRVTIRSLGPLGLAGRQRSTAAAWSVRTLPAFTSRRHLPSRLARLRDLDGRSVVAVRAAGSEFDSLREYVPGDDVRSIDWRASARADDVIVRTWRPERDRRILIVIDTGRTCAARVGDETRLDVLIDAALLLAALAGKAGDRVELMAHDRRTTLHIRAGAGTEVLSSLADALATTEPQLVETDYRGLVASVLGRLSKRAFVVVLTSLERPAMEEGLLPALPVLTGRHTVLVGAVSQPEAEGEGALTIRRGSAPGGAGARVSGAAASTPGVPLADWPASPERPRATAATELAEPVAAPDPDDIGVRGTYRRAALARERREREWTAAALSRLGVRVVDAPPDELAPRLADAYLDMKASGRL